MGFRDYLLKEMPLAFNHEERPLVKDWEPSKWKVQWTNVLREHGKFALAEGKGMMGIMFVGLFDVSTSQPELIVASQGSMINLKENGAPFGKAFKMIEVATEKKSRGKGTGTLFHELLIKQFGAIASDNALFSRKKDSIDGIIGIWLKTLPKKYTVRVYNDIEDNFVGPVGKKLDNDEDTILVATKY